MHSMQKHGAVVSEYFKNKAMDDSMQDFKNVKTQKVKQTSSKPKKPKKRNVMKCKGQRDIRTALANKKDDLISYTNDFHNVCLKSGIDIDSEQLQLAIAMSKSLCNQEIHNTDGNNPGTSAGTKPGSNQSQIRKIKNTLREYGFAVPETKGNLKKRRNQNDVREYKLLKATEEEKRQIVNDKVAEILFNFNSNAPLHKTSNEHNLIQLAGKSFFYLLDEDCFYTDLLDKASYTLGCRLKDWSKIPGRPESPQVSIKEIKFAEYIDNEDDLNVLMSSSMEIVQRLLSALKNEKCKMNECGEIYSSEVKSCINARDEKARNDIQPGSHSITYRDTSTCTDKEPTDFVIPRNVSPDLFDDEPSIHNSIHHKNSEIIEILDNNLLLMSGNNNSAQNVQQLFQSDDSRQCVNKIPFRNEEIDLTQSSNELMSPEIFDLTQEEASQYSNEIIEQKKSVSENSNDTSNSLPDVKLSGHVRTYSSNQILHIVNSTISDTLISCPDNDCSKPEEMLGMLPFRRSTGVASENAVNRSRKNCSEAIDREVDLSHFSNQSVIYEFGSANCEKSYYEQCDYEGYAESISINESFDKTIKYQDFNNVCDYLLKDNYEIPTENRNAFSSTPKRFNVNVPSKGDSYQPSDQEPAYSMEYFHKVYMSRNNSTTQKADANWVTPYASRPSTSKFMTPVQSISHLRSKSLGLDGSLPEVEIVGIKHSKEEPIKRSSRVHQLKTTHSSPCSPMKQPEGTSVVTPGNTEYIYKTTSVTPMADYAAFDTPKIHNELDKFGIRPIKRTKAVQLLEHIYYQTHPIMEYVDQGCPEKEPKRPRVEAGRKEEENAVMYEMDTTMPVLMEMPCKDSDLIFEKREKSKVHGCQVPLHIAFHNYLSARSALREAVLRYEPLSIDLIHKQLAQDGHKYDPKDLLKFLDQKCVTVKTAEGGKAGKRKKLKS